MELPTWVVNSSGVFFILGSVAFLVLAVLAIRLIFLIGELQKKVQRLTYKVESLSEKLESAAASAKDTVQKVGGSARTIASTMEGSLVGSVKKLEGLSTVLFLAMAGLRLWREFRGEPKPARIAAKVDTEDSDSA